MSRWRFTCPHGHRNVEMGTNRCWCETCRQQGRMGGFDKSELVDLANRPGGYGA